uniref:MCP methyltransferase, CheR-type n=1 Tax=Geobacter sp. (strain M21) TaxID=443144 RepID=C6DZA2_GEOSM
MVVMTLLRDFMELVATRTGLNFRDRDQAVFRNKVQERITRYRGSEWDYYELLQDETPESAREWCVLAALLTTGESYFFRDKGQFALLKNHILPELIKRKRQRRLRIWSAGCSSGEEPYSLAMVVKELLPVLDNWQIQIIGTDINSKVIDQAGKGIYTEWSFRQTEQRLRDKFFSKREGCWEIDPDIKAMVTYRCCNLVLDPFPDLSGELNNMDLIVCRNVFIYFHPEAVGQVVTKFADTLTEGGFLLTGHGELHLQALYRLKSRMIDEQMILQKGTDLTSAVSLPAVTPLHHQVVPASARPSAGTKKEQRLNPAAVSAKRLFAGHAAKPVAAGVLPHDLDRCLEQARRCADQGKYHDAARICRDVIRYHTLSPLPYFLLAQISEANGDAWSAKQCFKKAIYLDPSLIAPHLELGEMYLSEKKYELAAKSIRSARELLKVMPPGKFIALYSETTALELLRHADDLLDGLNKKEKTSDRT